MNTRDKLQAPLRDTAQNPLEATAKFLRIFFSDADGLDDARIHLTRMAGVNRRTIADGLAAIETLLADPPEEGALSYLVAVEANWPLDDPSDQGAMIWLLEITNLIRDVLGNSQTGMQSTVTTEGS